MSDKKFILIDMDGVLCDFVGSVCAILNCPYPNPWPSGIYSIAQAIGKTDKEFWRAIDAHGSNFWSDLQPYPYAEELYERLQKEYTVFFCSTPSQNPQSLHGKLLWLKNFAGNDCQNYVFTPNKFLCANPNSILIDDYDKNCNEFEEHKGYSVLFPQSWNSNFMFKDDPLQYVSFKLDKINDYIEMQKDSDGTNNYKGI